MKVELRELIDWENIHMSIHSDRDLSDDEIGKLKKLLKTWPETKAPPWDRGNCPPVAFWKDTDDRRTFRFYWEKWFPEEWIEPLALALASELPSLFLLEIGHAYEPPYRDDTAFIVVPHKVVELEDGRKVEVQPFEIAKYTVSIAQFERFTQATGHKTIAEQRDCGTFRDNIFISDIPVRKRLSEPAFCVSYLDALAYCEWGKMRLPTEAEWVAAAVIDDRVCEDKDRDRIRSELRKHPSALIKSWEEMTGMVIDGRFVIVRSGPYLIRTKSDLRSPSNRSRMSIRNCEDPFVFRVCR